MDLRLYGIENDLSQSIGQYVRILPFILSSRLSLVLPTTIEMNAFYMQAAYERQSLLF